MPATAISRDHVFDPEMVAVMGAAFDEACQSLGLVDRADKPAELVAKRVIELAKRGIRTKSALYRRTVQAFKD